MKWLSLVALAFIRIYQYTFSSFMGKSCRYYPTCSNYMVDAIKRFGLVKGGWMGIKRIYRCNPYNAGGYDPVPEKENNGKFNTKSE